MALLEPARVAVLILGILIASSNVHGGTKGAVQPQSQPEQSGPSGGSSPSPTESLGSGGSQPQAGRQTEPGAQLQGQPREGPQTQPGGQPREAPLGPRPGQTQGQSASPRGSRRRSRLPGQPRRQRPPQPRPSPPFQFPGRELRRGCIELKLLGLEGIHPGHLGAFPSGRKLQRSGVEGSRVWSWLGRNQGRGLWGGTLGSDFWLSPLRAYLWGPWRVLRTGAWVNRNGQRLWIPLPLYGFGRTVDLSNSVNIDDRLTSGVETGFSRRARNGRWGEWALGGDSWSPSGGFGQGGRLGAGGRMDLGSLLGQGGPWGQNMGFGQGGDLGQWGSLSQAGGLGQGGPWGQPWSSGQREGLSQGSRGGQQGGWSLGGLWGQNGGPGGFGGSFGQGSRWGQGGNGLGQAGLDLGQGGGLGLGGGWGQGSRWSQGGGTWGQGGLGLGLGQGGGLGLGGGWGEGGPWRQNGGFGQDGGFGQGSIWSLGGRRWSQGGSGLSLGRPSGSSLGGLFSQGSGTRRRGSTGIGFGQGSGPGQAGGLRLGGTLGLNGGFGQEGVFGLGIRLGQGSSGVAGQEIGSLFGIGLGGRGTSPFSRRLQRGGRTWRSSLGGIGGYGDSGPSVSRFGGEFSFGRQGRSRSARLLGTSSRRNPFSLWVLRGGSGSGQFGRRPGSLSGRWSYGSSWGSGTGSDWPSRSMWTLSQSSLSPSRFGSPYGGWYTWTSYGPRGRSIWTRLNGDSLRQFGLERGQSRLGSSSELGQRRIRE